MKKLIFATSNEEKMKEIREILADGDYEILSMAQAGFRVDVEENGATFEENARIKAQAVHDVSHTLVLADDSGLEIDYLNKEPGILSARYMGENTSYQVKNAKLLERLQGIPMERRTARFVCAVAAVFEDGRCVTVRETMEGYIGYEARGDNGFGYDPIFYMDPEGPSNSQLSMEEKNRLSHRGKALKAMKKELL
ncbi:MAG: RdgB/HAM1 family non-canonical purine NTP pyrophosphatase [Lachnospiraceae bacterium]|nr:RdgB/HAM1 family non-canonical purine NTP pyrophosphatase [Lachnospiraceae bacterium]MCI9546109.1 RdgB/HAM1 family non-canonical purine NTP pyrophosphatase [Lachnospiraceae bacterium]